MLNAARLTRIGGLATFADLVRAPLLDPADPWWDSWFQGAGVARSATPNRAAAGLGARHLEAVAAMAGHGVAILTPFFWRAELTDGRLVQPFDLVGRNGRAFWLCHPTGRRNLPKVRLLRDGLLGHVPHGKAGPT